MSPILFTRRGAPAQVPALFVPTVGVPDQVINVLLLSDGTPGTAYAVFTHPSANGSQVTQFEGLTSTGVTGVQPRFTLANSPVDAQACRVDFFGLTNVPMTAQVRARNANGAGPYSVASNSVTPVAFVDTWTDSHNAHYMLCGGSVIDVNPLWQDTFFDFQWVRTVAPGDSTTAGPHYNAAFTPAMNAPAYPVGVGMTNQLMVEITPQGTGGYGILVNILSQNPALDTNGVFNANPYSRICGYIYPTLGGTYVGGSETTFNIEGQVSAVSSGGGLLVNLDFANQDFTSGTFNSVAGSIGIFDRSNSASGAFSSNTTNRIVASSNLTFHAADYVNTQIGDQGTASYSSLAAFVTGPVPGVLTLNQWNSFEMGIGAGGMNILAFNNGMHYKWGIAVPGNGSGSVTYLTKLAWVV